ncbi:MAG: helix-turn-helix transcriptional regulator [Elusimicrobiales bacterium]|nr:helix-turn-helix transcriptional regulator [Elusimicrobiales bacterium]
MTRRDIHAILGDRIRQERKRAALSMERLAELAGISTSFLAYIETKRRKASLETIEKIAAALRIPVAELFTTVPGPRKDSAYDAAQVFVQLIRDKKPGEIETALEIARSALKSMSVNRDRKKDR